MSGDRPALQFALNAEPKTSTMSVGREQEPVIVVDGLLEKPEELVAFAARDARFEPFGSRGGYPGIVAPAPLDYVSAVVRALSPTIEQAFGLHQVKLSRAQCRLSMVTTPAQDLAPLQRIPHVDTFDPLQFALLHYLCDARAGGTAFYRHRATGRETLDERSWAEFERVRDEELARRGSPPSYITGGTEHYEQIGAVEARFNRLVIYRSRLLHSGIIKDTGALSEDPRHGRLTANIFVNYRQL